MLEIEGDSPPKVSPNGSGGQKEAKERLYYGEMQDSSPNVQLTPLASLRSKVKERSLVQNGSSNAGLMLTAC
ncbi:hypothetical protein E2C01_096968 [Portunus trituberculatus]|uniref:Uncharacterized protein n=1 Tax=Portunus trituberculatus TaxID=210409 RepID=A0A5B7JX18_PORTR|nr:hypothetical protein [Portunus trituberculatus]